MNVPTQVSWDFPVAKEQLITGFKTKTATVEGGPYTNAVVVNDPSLRTATISLPSGGIRYIVVTAFNSEEETAVSNEISIDLSLESPTNLRFGT